MAKRRLLLEVDCGKRRCKRCEHVDHDDWCDGPGCSLFDAVLPDADGKLLRIPACIEADEEAERLAAPVYAPAGVDQAGWLVRYGGMVKP